MYPKGFLVVILTLKNSNCGIDIYYRGEDIIFFFVYIHQSFQILISNVESSCAGRFRLGSGPGRTWNLALQVDFFSVPGYNWVMKTLLTGVMVFFAVALAASVGALHVRTGQLQAVIDRSAPTASRLEIAEAVKPPAPRPVVDATRVARLEERVTTLEDQVRAWSVVLAGVDSEDWVPLGGEWFGTWYAPSDAYTSAHWNGRVCYDEQGEPLPPQVDETHFGAAAPRWIPLCTRLRVCDRARCVDVTTVDRMRDDVVDSQPHIDLWPAAADAVLPGGVSKHLRVLVR